VAPRGHTHWEGGPVCDLPTKKACDERKADWDAMQQVILAYNVVVRGDARRYRKEKSVIGQLVRYISGDQEDIMNDDGNASQAPWVLRLRSAIERFKAGDLPVYCLYEPSIGHTKEASCPTSKASE
jgi:hypothetical protein